MRHCCATRTTSCCRRSASKARIASARQTLQELNPHVMVTCRDRCADAALLDTLLPDVDGVLDCTDNFAMRQCINAACVRHRTPCYACASPADALVQEILCSTMGVLGSLPGMMGSMQAAETLKLLLGTYPALSERFWMLQAQTLELTELRFERNPACAVCSDR